MKKLISKIKMPNNRQLLIALYIILAIVMLLYGFFSFGIELALRHLGMITTMELTADQIGFVDIVTDENGVISSTSGDCQIHLPPGDRLITSVMMNIEFSGETGELTAYYTDEEGAEFAAADRVYGTVTEQGAYFDFGLRKVNRVRLDPTNYTVEIGVFESVIINPPRDFSDYFTIGAPQIYFFALIPAMVWAIILSIKKQLAGKDNDKNE